MSGLKKTTNTSIKIKSEMFSQNFLPHGAHDNYLAASQCMHTQASYMQTFTCALIHKYAHTHTLTVTRKMVGTFSVLFSKRPALIFPDKKM